MSPQWEGELEPVSDDNNEDEVEHEYVNVEDWNCEGLDNAVAGGARDYISEVRESSLWAPLCDCLTPADVLYHWVQVGTMRNFMVNSQNYGSSL